MTKMKLIFLTMLLLTLNIKGIAQINSNKVLWAKSDTLNAKMTISQGDEIYFSVSDNQMNVIRIDSISGDCNLNFKLDIRIPLKLEKYNNYAFKTSLENLHGYIKFKNCELAIKYRGSLKKFVFVNR